MSDLIDTTEMYLRTIFELQEEGIPPMRARIAERLGQSGPTVSQTVARMERDDLVTLDDDRVLRLTPSGERMATRVMRKHRLAERLLVDVIGVPWEDVHAEACRWEHVISEEVERRLLVVLDHPTQSPYGNPIPGLAELEPDAVDAEVGTGIPLTDVVGDDVARVLIQRLAEPLQEDAVTMRQLRRSGALPGATVKASRSPGGITLGGVGEYVELSEDLAQHVLVAPRP